MLVGIAKRDSEPRLGTATTAQENGLFNCLTGIYTLYPPAPTFLPAGTMRLPGRKKLGSELSSPSPLPLPGEQELSSPAVNRTGTLLSEIGPDRRIPTMPASSDCTGREALDFLLELRSICRLTPSLFRGSVSFEF